MKITRTNGEAIDVTDIEDAATDILGHDGHGYDIVAEDGEWRAYRTRRSRNAMGGAGGMVIVASVPYGDGQHSIADLHQAIIDNFSNEWTLEE